MFTFRTLVFLGLLSIASPQAQAVTYLIGSDTVCDPYSLQEAINRTAQADHPGRDTIRVAMNANLQQQALSISNQELTLEGGFADCTQANAGVRTGYTVMSGFGGGTAPTLRIHGQNTPAGSSYKMSLSGFVITGGDTTSDGGGLRVTGDVELTLNHLSIEHNHADGSGGGIAILLLEESGVLRVPRLQFGTDIQILENTAGGDGGGIFADIFSLLILKGRLTIKGNRADEGSGGGVAFKYYLSLASTGFDSTPLISENHAKRGGGLALIGQYPGTLSISAASVDAPTVFFGNTAEQGGAIWMTSAVCDGCGETTMKIFGSSFAFNRAQQGAAIYVTSDKPLTSACILGPGEECDDLGTSLIECNAATCGTFATNEATDPNGAIIFTGNSDFKISKQAFYGNMADRLISTASGSTSHTLTLENSLIAANPIAQSVITLDGDGSILRGFQNTIADNLAGVDVVTFLGQGSTFALANSLIDQPGSRFVYPQSTIEIFSSNLVSPGGGNFLATGIELAPLHFIKQGDYRLREGSPAVDFAASEAAGSTDRLGMNRDIDTIKLNRNGPRDLGVFARIEGALVENQDFHQHPAEGWHYYAPAVTWASDAISISIPAVQAPPALVMARQCIPLPKPGEYSIEMLAKSSGSVFSQTRDAAQLRWLVRSQDDGTCSQGAIVTMSGALSTDSPSYSTRSSDVYVPPVMFSNELARPTTMEIVLETINNPIGTAPLAIAFDYAKLTFLRDAPLPGIFVDGFE